MSDSKFIALLPLDNRPVSYLLPKQIADFSGLNLILPERKYLGDLKQGSNLTYLQEWINKLTNVDSLVIALDNWVYGGLVQSRKHDFSLDELKSRVGLLTDVCRDWSRRSLCERASPQLRLASSEASASWAEPVPTKIYGFSSIMRIPNYNSNEEEKDYWKDYGEKIFQWSELMHKVGRGIKETLSNEELIEKWYQSAKALPIEVLTDFKSHMEKNFSINVMWLESLHNDCFQYLIFSCDDSGKYGMNVIEADYIKDQINKHRFSHFTKVISGTDEIPLVLLTKAVLDKSKFIPSIALHFNSEIGKDEISRYESNTINKSILNQVDTLGLEIKDVEKSDLILCIHCADSIQGDHIFKNTPSDTKGNAKKLVHVLDKTNKPFILLDFAYANGADPILIEELLNANINWKNCYGYSAWNTTSNSTGCALSIGINRWLSEKENRFNEREFKKCLLTRFLDDYAYQTQIRHTNTTEEEINEKIKTFIQAFSKLLHLHDINVRCSLPWKRSFEVEIDIS